MTLPDQLAITPVERFEAVVRPPGSKSLTNRALLLAALARGESVLDGILLADDTRRMLEALSELGFDVSVDEQKRRATIVGQGGRIPADQADLFLGNAGTATRFLTAAACLGRGEITIDGIARMRQRPIGELVRPLRALGAAIAYLGDEGYPPLRIEAAGLRGGDLTLQPTLSSQFISALLHVGPYMSEGLTLRFDGPITSLPYVVMTLNVMNQFGVQADFDEHFARIVVAPGGYRSVDLAIEPDASNASYFLAAAAVLPGSRVTVEGLGAQSLQGDARFAHVLRQMGAEAHVDREATRVVGSDRLRGIDIDLNDMPDLAQTLAVVALFAEGPTTIRNIGNLRVKETDRLAALQNELSKLGGLVQVAGDDLIITPPVGGISPATINTYDDHRMAMSFAVAGLVAPGVVIDDPGCVAKSYPEFFADLTEAVGATGAAS